MLKQQNMINYKNIIQALTDMGLSEKEANIYITLLNLGEQPASVISRVTKINRTTVYDILDSLIQKGLAHKTDISNKIYFKVIDPNRLQNYLEIEKKSFIKAYEKKVDNLSKVIEDMEKIKLSKPTKPVVKYYEGERGLQEAYEDTLQSNEEIRAYANIEEMHKGLPHFFPEYYKRRSDAQIFINTIAPNNNGSLERSKLDKKEFREIRFIDKDKYEFTPEINIYDNKILFASWKEKMAVVIESEEIADFHKKVFDVLYSKLK